MQKDLPVRKNIRLDGYDYSSNGAYFITICVKDGHEMLGNIAVGAIINRPQAQISEYGVVVDKAINEISIRYPQIMVNKYVIMPNHIHMILAINNDDNGRLLIAPTSISTAVQQLKRHVSKQIGFSLWHTGFHDRILRNREEYQVRWQYIDSNPARWAEDEYYSYVKRKEV
jgi:REP element-mobilizing transposase RayT